MKHGDISNQTLPMICFDLEGFLVSEEDAERVHAHFEKLVRFRGPPHIEVVDLSAAIISSVWGQFTVFVLSRYEGKTLEFLEEKLTEVFISRVRSLPTYADFKRFLLFNNPEFVFSNMPAVFGKNLPRGVEPYVDEYDLASTLQRRFGLHVKGIF